MIVEQKVPDVPVCGENSCPNKAAYFHSDNLEDWRWIPISNFSMILLGINGNDDEFIKFRCQWHRPKEAK